MDPAELLYLFYILACFYGAYIILKIIVRLLLTVKRGFFPSSINHQQRYGEGSWVLITGCTEGMGKQMVLDFAKKGFGVILVARNLEKMEKTVKWVENQVKDSFKSRVVVFDFSKSTTVDYYEEHLISKVKDLEISIIVNNVGLNQIFELRKNSLDECLRTTKVNIYPTTILTSIFLPLLEQRAKKSGKRSAIVSIASQSDMHFLPGSPLYAAQKRYVRNLLVAVQNGFEVKLTDLSVVVPATVSTAMTKQEAGGEVARVEDASQAILNKMHYKVQFGVGKHELFAEVLKILMDLLPWGSWLNSIVYSIAQDYNKIAVKSLEKAK